MPRDKFATTLVSDSRSKNRPRASFWSEGYECVTLWSILIAGARQLGLLYTDPFIEDGGAGPKVMIGKLPRLFALSQLSLASKFQVCAHQTRHPSNDPTAPWRGRPWNAGGGPSVTAMALALVLAILDGLASNPPGLSACRVGLRDLKVSATSATERFQGVSCPRDFGSGFDEVLGDSVVAATYQGRAISRGP